MPDQALASTPSKASGLTKYRAPTAPLQRSKLESFDRKIGRATNSLQVPPFERIVCTCIPSLRCVWSAGVLIYWMAEEAVGTCAHGFLWLSISSVRTYRCHKASCSAHARCNIVCRRFGCKKHSPAGPTSHRGFPSPCSGPGIPRMTQRSARLHCQPLIWTTPSTARCMAPPTLLTRGGRPQRSLRLPVVPQRRPACASWAALTGGSAERCVLARGLCDFLRCCHGVLQKIPTLLLLRASACKSAYG